MEQTDVTISASDQEEADIRTIHLLRGAIITAYSQAEFLLTDLYFRARQLDDYSNLPNRLPYRLETKISRIKAVSDLPGPISHFRRELHMAADGILKFEKVRHFMAHGMLVEHKDENGKHHLLFRGYVEENGQPVLEILRGDVDLMQRHLQIIETYTYKFVSLAHKIIEECKLPQIG